MKKLLLSSLALAILASAWFLVPNSTSEADAAGCFRCFPGGTTNTVWGFGSTCQAATNDGISQASALIPYTCDVCGETPIGVAPCDLSCSNPSVCYDPYGEWRVDLKLRYRRNVDICQ